MKRHLDFYITNLKLSIMSGFQYRLQMLTYVIWAVIEPVIYLVVWSTIARGNGGSVGGYTPGALAAYYIVWSFVRNMNIVSSPSSWEWRIQHGRMSMELMRPIHPLHNDVTGAGGSKVVMSLIWLPIAAVLTLLFKPTLNPTWFQVLVFFIACWGAYLLRTMLVSVMGVLAFWITRVEAITDVYNALELVFSGRLIPMPLMPGWVQTLANYLPFQWTFYFPINALTGSPTPAVLLQGLGMQLLWFLAGLALVNLVWHFAVRHFSSVGN